MKKCPQVKGLVFSTNEVAAKFTTKCILFGKVNISQVAQIVLNGNSLPWISESKHLGHTLQSDNTMRSDILVKRGTFIGKVNSLMQEFHYAAPHLLLNLIHSYACNLYGSNLWDTLSTDCQKICTRYNVAVRNIYNLPRAKHRYLLEPLTDMPHLYVLLLARYVTFGKSLLSNDALEVRYLAGLSAGNMRTTLGRTLAKVANLCGHPRDIDAINAKMVKLHGTSRK